MSLPKDLSDSEEVRVSYVNENFTDFNDKVLKFVKNDEKVLVIVVSDFPQIFDEVIKAVSQEGNDDVIAYYAWNESSSVTLLSEHTVKWRFLQNKIIPHKTFFHSRSEKVKVRTF
jgi:uncharacterized protein YtpQ (UPF0354 family)